MLARLIAVKVILRIVTALRANSGARPVTFRGAGGGNHSNTLIRTSEPFVRISGTYIA